MSDAITGLVRVLHILSAATWLGATFLWSMVIAPRVLARGPPAIRRPFAETIIGPLTNFFRVAGGLTLGSGILLVGMIWGWGDYFAAFEAPTYGPALALGALAAVGMAIVGFVTVPRTARKLVATMQTITGPPSAEQQATMAVIGKKLGITSMVAVLFGTIAITGMTWAVNHLR